MNTNDTLLIKMITQDMAQKGIADIDYWIAEDKVVASPTKIEVKVNEVVYLYYFRINNINNFKVQAISATTVTSYEQSNCHLDPYLNTTRLVNNYESNVITSHLSTLTFNATALETGYLIRYVKVKFNSQVKKGNTTKIG